MANITVRNIPDSILGKVRTLSEIEKRSINNELLILIEHGLNQETEKKGKQENIISKESQMKIWEKLLGKWEDERSVEKIIEDI